MFLSTNADDENFDVGAETAYGIRNNGFTISGSGLLCETTYFSLENVMHLMVPSQKNTSSRFSMLQSKALHFHYFILKVPCFFQFLGNRELTTIISQGQFHHLFYQVRVKKTVLLIFQLTFVQDSQMILLPQFQTIVTLFLDMTWCVQLLQIIETWSNTGKELLYQTLQPLVWIYAARMIRIFFIPLTSAIWLKMYALLKSIFNGISS